MKKAILLASILLMSLPAMVGCWQSPANCSLVIGYHAERVHLADASSATNAVPSSFDGSGNNARVYIRQSNVAYKSPANSSSNNVSPSLSVPLTN